MMSKALNPKRWNAFLEGRMSADAAADLAARLRRGCADSEDFLVDRPGDVVDLLHGVHDDLYGGEAALSDEQVDEACARVLERLGAVGHKKTRRHVGPWHQELPFSISSVPPPKRPRRRGSEPLRRRLAFAGGTVVTVFLALVLDPVGDLKATWNGSKGATVAEATTPEVGVTFAVAHSGRVVRPGRTGATVSSEADLLFRFRVTGGPAHVYLVRVQGAKPVLVWPPAGTPSQPFEGARDLDVDGVVQGVPMTALQGNVHFVAVASRTPLAQPQVGPWVDAGTDTVMVKVRPEPRP